MHHKSRLSLIVRAVKVIEFLATPGWKTYMQLAAYLEVDYKTARRWIQAMEQAGLCIELQSENGNHNGFRLSMSERSLRATNRIRMAESKF